MNLKVIALSAALALSGCAASGTAPTSYGPSAVAGLEGTYVAAVSAEIVYEKSGKANPALLAKIEADRKSAYALLSPLVAAAERGQSVATVAEYEAAQAALTALTAIVPTTPASGA